MYTAVAVVSQDSSRSLRYPLAGVLNVVPERLLVAIISTLIFILTVPVPPVQLALRVEIEIVEGSAQTMYSVAEPLTKIPRLDGGARRRRGWRGGPDRLHIISIESVL